jgi:hypothetical protein
MKNHWGMARRALGLGVLVATAASGSAHAATSSGTSACTPPSYTLSQPYLASGDSNWYTLAPGQSADSFNATGWTLTGGAKLVTTTLADGTIGTVLDLPAGSTAVSPPMCVDSEFPTARMNVLQTGNGPGMHVYVAYTADAGAGQSSGVVNGASTWSASRAIQLHAGNLAGWQNAQYTFEGDKGGIELYDFYVDPHSRS